MLLSLVPLAAHALTLTLADTSELRLRADTGGPYVDVATTPRATLRLSLRRTSWSISYAPTLMETGVGSPNQSRFLLHTGGLMLQLRLSRTTTAAVTEDGTFGTQNIRIQGVTTPATTASGNPTSDSSATTGNGTLGVTPNVLAASGARTITFGSLATSVGVTHLFPRAWSGNASLGYAVWGQLDSREPIAIPTSRTYAGSGSLTHSFSGRDQLLLSEAARYIVTEPNAEALVLTSTAGWNHRFSTTISSALFSAATYVRATDVTGYSAKHVLPGGGAALTYARPIFPGSSITATASVGVVPFVDARFGGVAQSITSSGVVLWTRSRLSLQATGYASKSLESYGTVSVLTVYGAAETIGYRLDREGQLTVSAGTRQTFLRMSAGQNLPVVWLAFVGFTYTSRATSL